MTYLDGCGRAEPVRVCAVRAIYTVQTMDTYIIAAIIYGSMVQTVIVCFSDVIGKVRRAAGGGVKIPRETVVELWKAQRLWD